MKKATKTVYECEFCGKLSYNAGGMHNHEKRCKKNPVNIPMCWDCKHYYFWPEEIVVPYDHVIYGMSCEAIMKVKSRKCLKTGLNMFSILTSERKIADLEGVGLVMMPCVAYGCEHYEKAISDAQVLAMEPF